MKRLFSLSFAAVLCAMTFMLPTATEAKVGTLDSISPSESVRDITPADEFDPELRSEEYFQVFWLYTEVGEDYVANFSFDEMPLMVFVNGGAMTLDSNWTRDKEALTATVNFTSRDLQQVDAEVEDNAEEGETLTTIAFIWEPEEGDGPGEQTDGAWVSTDFQEYSLITDSTRMGAQVRGDVGDAGQFNMYMPASAVSSMAINHEEYDHEDFDPEEDMGVYTGDTEQAEVEVEGDEEGGAYIAFTAEIDAEDAVGNEGGEGGEECEEGDPECECPEEEECECPEGEDCEEGEHQSLSIFESLDSAVQVRVTAGPRDSQELGAVTPDTPALKTMKVPKKKKKKKRATLKWVEVEGATSYTIQLKKCKNIKKKKCTKKKHFQKKKKWRRIKNVEATKKVVKKLKPGNYYQWRLKACNDSGCSEFTKWKRFKTKGVHPRLDNQTAL